MSRLDYSKWDHIEISDDEDDTHPNIDTPSLFRWRHQARVEKMEKQAKEKENLEKEFNSRQSKMNEIKAKIKKAETEQLNTELEKLKLQEKELLKQEKEWRKKEAELQKEIKNTPLNIDTLCKEGKDKTVINKARPRKTEALSEEEKAEKLGEFVKKHKTEIRKFGMLQKYDDSKDYLKEHPYLVCEETANHLVIWCIDLQVEEKKELMEHVAHQTIVMQFILQLAESLNIDPRDCVNPFFSRIKMAEQQYMDAFNDELNSFKKRVKERAEIRIQEAMKEYEEEERQKRLGPGGLDPVEVFESLPEDLQNCFESKDIQLLQETIVKLPKEDAEYYMKRCIDSGLWVPNAADAQIVQDQEETPTS